MSQPLPAFDFGLGETIEMLRESTWAFAQKEVAPLAAEVDRTNTFPRALWPKLGELGLLGITVEPEYGGVAMGYLAHCVAMEELSRASAAVGSVLRRALEPVRESAAPLRHGGAETDIPAARWCRANIWARWR